MSTRNIIIFYRLIATAHHRNVANKGTFWHLTMKLGTEWYEAVVIKLSKTSDSFVMLRLSWLSAMVPPIHIMWLNNIIRVGKWPASSRVLSGLCAVPSCRSHITKKQVAILPILGGGEAPTDLFISAMVTQICCLKICRDWCRLLSSNVTLNNGLKLHEQALTAAILLSFLPSDVTLSDFILA